MPPATLAAFEAAWGATAITPATMAEVKVQLGALSREIAAAALADGCSPALRDSLLELRNGLDAHLLAADVLLEVGRIDAAVGLLARFGACAFSSGSAASGGSAFERQPVPSLAAPG